MLVHYTNIKLIGQKVFQIRTSEEVCFGQLDLDHQSTLPLLALVFVSVQYILSPPQGWLPMGWMDLGLLMHVLAEQLAQLSEWTADAIFSG